MSGLLACPFRQALRTWTPTLTIARASRSATPLRLAQPSAPRSFTCTAQRPATTAKTSSAYDDAPSTPRSTPPSAAFKHRSIPKGLMTIERARKLIIGARSKISRMRDHSLERRKELAANVAASEILDWFLAEKSKYTSHKDYDDRFVEALCWHLYAEGHEQRLWDWFAQEVHEDPSPRTTRILAGILDAKMCWDPARSVDAVIQALFEAESKWDVKSPLAFHKIEQRALFRTEARLCSEQLYDRFSEMELGKYFNGSYADRREFKKALLDLYHPSKPSADVLVDVWRKREQHANKSSWIPGLAPTNAGFQHVGLRRKVRFLTRASYILRLQGKDQDAEWLEGKIRADEGLSWLKGMRLQLLDDPRMDGLRQQNPTKAESIAEAVRGVPEAEA